jgi:hypothetical protein
MIVWFAAAAFAGGHELGLRSEAGVAVRVADDWTLGLAQLFRAQSTKNQGPSWFTDVEATWRWNKRVKLGVGYRGGVDDLGSGPDPTHRVHLEGRWSDGFGLLDLGVRQRAQLRLPGWGNSVTLTSRTKLSVGLDVPWSPTLSTEWFLAIEQPVALNRVRAGFEVRPPIDAFDLDLGYLMNAPLDGEGDPVIHNVVVTFTVPLDARRRDPADDAPQPPPGLDADPAAPPDAPQNGSG